MPRKKKPAKVNVEEVREKLLLLRTELITKAKDHTIGSHGASKGDLVDQSTTLSEQELKLGLQENDRAKLRSIDEALAKMEENTYGFCTECSEPIPVERLLVVPSARYCVPCKEKLERSGMVTR